MAISCSKLFSQDNNYFLELNETNGWNLNFKYSPSSEQFIQNCRSLSFDGLYNTPCGQITKSITGEVVYTINYYNNISQLKRHAAVRSKNIYFVVFNGTLVHSSKGRLFVFMKPNNVDVYNEEISPISLPLRENNLASYDISYSYTKNTLLTTPYDTNCFNYKTVQLDSQANCFENCVLYAATRNHIEPKTIITRKSVDHEPIKVMVSNYNCKLNITEFQGREELKCFLQLSQICNEICKKRDCIKEIFLAKLEDVFHQSMGEFSSRTFREATIRLQVKPLNSLSVIVTHLPRITPVDYITYLLSCVSFWLGISPLSFLLQIKVKRVKQYIHRMFAEKNTIELNAIMYYGDCNITMVKLETLPTT